VTGVISLSQAPRILFVDDHEDTRYLITYLLDSWGYAVEAARSIEEGLRLARAGGFHLYLLDSRFGDGSGTELCEGIREFDKTTPIVFYSGDHPSRLKKALECDAQGFVLKPGLDALPRELERALATSV
jgi:CheY-like chemotaxis protein